MVKQNGSPPNIKTKQSVECKARRETHEARRTLHGILKRGGLDNDKDGVKTLWEPFDEGLRANGSMLDL
jgi:hypothetical protein